MSTPRKPVTLGEAVAAFLNTLTPSTRRSYATALDALADEYGPGKALASLDPAAVAAWFTARWEGRSASTWNLRLASLRAATAWWEEEGWQPPLITGRLRSRKPHGVMAPDVLTEDELRAMLAQCSLQADTGIRNRALITVMYRSGLRISEALALRVSDVSAERGTLTVRAGKGGKPRVVAVDDGALAVLQRWRDKRSELGIRANGHPLFCTLDGGEMSDRYVRALVTRIASKAGVDKRAHPHGLRRSHAAELVGEGVPGAVIQQQLGHASLAVTDRYTRNIAPEQVIAMGRARHPFSDTGEAPEPEPEGEGEGEPDLAAELGRMRLRLASLEQADKEAQRQARIAQVKAERRARAAEAKAERARAAAREARRTAKDNQGELGVAVSLARAQAEAGLTRQQEVLLARDLRAKGAKFRVIGDVFDRDPSLVAHWLDTADRTRCEDCGYTLTKCECTTTPPAAD